jgi:chromosome segregation ATPase
MRKEWDMNMESRILMKEREWQVKFDQQASEIAKLRDQSDKMKKSHEEMKTIVTEYERTMTQIIELGLVCPAEKENTSMASKESYQDLVKEKDQALEDLQNVEVAFSDLHRRYEKTKAAVEGFKQNEEILKKCVADYQAKLKKQEERYTALKKHAEEKLEVANEEIEKVRKSTQTELARLQAVAKKSELQIQSLEQTIEQKNRETKELTAICDELIAKVGPQ